MRAWRAACLGIALATTTSVSPAGFALSSRSEVESTGRTFDVAWSDLSVRQRPAGTTLQVHVEATATSPMDHVRIGYCGPAVLFLSVDGSTVETTSDPAGITGRLHQALAPGERFAFRYVAVVGAPEGEAPPEEFRLVDGLPCISPPAPRW